MAASSSGYQSEAPSISLCPVRLRMLGVARRSHADEHDKKMAVIICRSDTMMPNQDSGRPKTSSSVKGSL
jgi:hypothetical protein